MVTAFVVIILLAQLWMFTVTLEAMEARHQSVDVLLAAVLCSFVGSAAVWALIRFFLKTTDSRSI